MELFFDKYRIIMRNIYKQDVTSLIFAGGGIYPRFGAVASSTELYPVHTESHKL